MAHTFTIVVRPYLLVRSPCVSLLWTRDRQTINLILIITWGGFNPIFQMRKIRVREVMRLVPQATQLVAVGATI